MKKTISLFLSALSFLCLSNNVFTMSDSERNARATFEWCKKAAEIKGAQYEVKRALMGSAICLMGSIYFHAKMVDCFRERDNNVQYLMKSVPLNASEQAIERTVHYAEYIYEQGTLRAERRHLASKVSFNVIHLLIGYGVYQSYRATCLAKELRSFANQL